MKKRIPALLLSVAIVLGLCGCNGNKVTSSLFGSSGLGNLPIIEESKYAVNPLTGTENLAKDAVLIKPVAIMINNISTAWNVQSSLSKADIIYETNVEGGITRLLAVYKDIRTVKNQNLGSCRSGRYSYVELAMGNGAQFVHAGLDDRYCRPHINELGIKSYDLNNNITTGNVIGGNDHAFRLENGLSYEHTLYTTGKKLYKGLKANFKMKLKSAQDNWMNFLDEDKAYTPADGTCKEVYVPFSGSYYANFKYNKKTAKYVKYREGVKQQDYNDGKTVSFKNILVLYSTVTCFPDGKHMKTDLSSGKGYYISNGGYRKINWAKGNASDSFKITDDEGKEIDYNAGKTYVCLTDKSNKSATVITPYKEKNKKNKNK